MYYCVDAAILQQPNRCHNNRQSNLFLNGTTFSTVECVGVRVTLNSNKNVHCTNTYGMLIIYLIYLPSMVLYNKVTRVSTAH